MQRTPAEWALRYVADFPEVLTILRRDEQPRLRSMRILKFLSDVKPNSLTKEELDTIKKAADEYNRLIKAACTGCKY